MSMFSGIRKWYEGKSAACRRVFWAILTTATLYFLVAPLSRDPFLGLLRSKDYWIYGLRDPIPISLFPGRETPPFVIYILIFIVLISILRFLSVRGALKLGTRTIQIFIVSLFLVSLLHTAVGRRESMRLAEYIALLAVFVSIGHLTELVKTHSAVDASREALVKTHSAVDASREAMERLRKEVSYREYVEKAHAYYATAQERILACVRYWGIENDWLQNHHSELSQGHKRESDTGKNLPDALGKYLDCSLAKNLMARSMQASVVKFMGPVGYRSKEELVAFPGVLWRILVLKAVKSYWSLNSPLRPMDADAFSFNSLPYFFVVVDDKVLMETPRQSGFVEEFQELGHDLGDHPQLARHLATDFGYFASKRATDSVNDIIRCTCHHLARGTKLDKRIVWPLPKFIYCRTEGETLTGFAKPNVVAVALDRLQRTHKSFDISEWTEDLVAGLVYDYLCYVGREEFSVDVH
jgi:hypothetical protein